jgi:hypothetical protein
MKHEFIHVSSGPEQSEGIFNVSNEMRNEKIGGEFTLPTLHSNFFLEK